MTLKNIFDMIGAILFSILTGFGWGLFATEHGVPSIIIAIVGFSIGFILPGIILKWIDKPDTLDKESGESEE